MIYEGARTNAKVGVDAGIAGSASQVLVLTVWDVEMSFRVAVFFRKTKVNNVDLVSTLANSHQEVVRLDITVNEGLGMDVLDAGDELVRQEKYSLQGEFAVAEVKEILQTGSKEIQHHSIVVTLGSVPTDKGDANAAGKGLVDAGFILELGMFGLDALELDGDFLSGDDVGALNTLEIRALKIRANIPR